MTFLNFQLQDTRFKQMLSPRRNLSGVSLPSRTLMPQIDQPEAGLTSTQGAEEIISMICARRVVNRMILGHNDLQDEGCIALFSFLRSSAGRRYRISEISLNANGIGNKGLLEMSEYLRGNENLHELCIQNNSFDASVTNTFVEALNTSHLTLLSLTTNRLLCDEFAEHFFPKLNAPYLRELNISAIGLTTASAHHIAEFLASPRSKLRVLRCNGNSLGLKGVRVILRAVRKHNYRILKLELYANNLSETDSEGSSNSELEDSDDENNHNQRFPDSAPHEWVICEGVLKRLLNRNMRLKKSVEEEALQLLCCARALLLHSSSRSDQIQPRVEPRTSAPSVSSTTFDTLPPELHLHIFSFIAPTLSLAQLVRVYEYAASPRTLPPLLPRLYSSFTTGPHSSLCYPDPSHLVFGSGSGKTSTLGVINSDTVGERCSDGQCMGSDSTLVCRRDKSRARWLEAVACTVYEHYSVC